jgi:hypothetical protein
MMKITQDMNYTGPNEPVKKLVADLKAWHQDHPFSNGIDWAMQTYWATMQDEDCFAFCLNHPEYTERFRRI